MRCFDFCFTLVSVNTTYSFVDYCVSNSSVYFKIRLIFLKVFSKLLLKVNLISLSQHSKFRVYALKGLSLLELEKFSREFAFFLDKKVNSDVFDILYSCPFEGAIVVSNSLQFVIEDFLRFKGLKHRVIGSSLGVNQLKCSGRYSLYVPELGKVRVLLETIPDVTISEFFTDDFEADYDLVKYSSISRLVSEGKVVL